MVRFSKVIAGNSDLLTAQAFVFQNLSLTLAFLITASGEDVFTKVRLTATVIEEQFFADTDLIPARLEKSLETAKEELKDYQDLQIEFFVWQENLLYISSHGNHHAFLLRGNQLTHLTPEDGNEQLISGHLKPGDHLLFVTSSFNKLNNIDSLKKLALISIELFEEEVNSIWRQSWEPIDQTEALEEKATDLPISIKQPIAAILVDYHSDQLEKTSENTSIKEQSKRIINFKASFQIFSNLIPRSNKVRLAAIIVLILLAGTLIDLSLTNKNKTEKTNQINTFISQGKDKLSQAEVLKDSDPVSARQSLDDAKKSADQALSISPENNDVKDLRKQIDNQSPGILKIYQVDNFPVFLTLDLIKPGFSTKKLSYSLGKIAMLDETKKTLVVIDLSTKENKILAGLDQLGAAKAASLNGDFSFVYSEDKGVVRVDTKSQKSTAVIKVDTEWGKIIDIVGFGGNAYLLDILKNQIWKYIPAAASYSDKITYFKDNKGLDFADAKRMEIDSSVWILKSGNELKKYTSGVEDNFSVQGLDKDLSSVNTFFTSDRTDNIYLLDQGNGRLIVLDKKGQYISQYQGDKFKATDDLMVDEKGKKIYLLEANKIYQIDLK